jgi:exopolyphosphatase/guanosine-5'-triphosphate,3'-diphosphate pyrophosphatase
LPAIQSIGKPSFGCAALTCYKANMPRYAAIDIGSNSVRMMAADVVGGETRILVQDRQVTRLGESVFRDGRISQEGLDFLCATLARMSAAYGRLEVDAVRAVATSAVRDAGNQQEFLQRTSTALATNVEIISGPEEARLIHLGVEGRWPRPKERTLIIDVGGGSAELIVSYDGQLLDSVSKPLGAVRLTELFLKSDPPTHDEVQRLFGYIDEKLMPFLRSHGTEKFQRSIATSATAAAIISAANGIPRTKRDEADRMGARLGQVRDLFRELVNSDLAAKRKIVGIGPRRAEIVTAGTAVFLRTLELFDLKSINYCVAGVRDGIIADLWARGVGRERSQLPPEQRAVLEALAEKYRVSMKHARHVAKLAHRLFELLQPLHKLPQESGRLLESAALLHDIGHFVSDTGHHKHSAYLIANSDFPGFTDKERITIAALCRFHRKSLPQPRYEQYALLSAESKRLVMSLTPLLRIADALDRGHEQKVEGINGGLKQDYVALEIETNDDADLEIWASEEASQAFQQVYQMPVVIQAVRSRAIA